MSNYGWFCIKQVALLILIGWTCYVFRSLMPLWALFFLSDYQEKKD
jgi:hypothetical protein